jgi:hypothetical protein
MDRSRYDAGMFDGEAAAGDALQRIDEWERSLGQRAEQAQELARKIAELTVTAHSSDGLVEVTVGAEGRVGSIHLDERASGSSRPKTPRGT